MCLTSRSDYTPDHVIRSGSDLTVNMLKVLSRTRNLISHKSCPLMLSSTDLKCRNPREHCPLPKLPSYRDYCERLGTVLAPRGSTQAAPYDLVLDA